MTTIKEIVEYSKANPNTDYAKKAWEHIQSGAFDKHAVEEGYDLSWAGRGDRMEKLKTAYSGAEKAKQVSEEANKPTTIIKETAKESVKKLGEISGITPTAKKIAASVAPYVVPEEELPSVVEELAGGVVTPEKSKAKEFTETFLDLPVVSLGLSKNLAKSLGEQGIKVTPELMSKFLSKELSSFLPDVLTDFMKKDVSEVAKPVTDKVGSFVDNISTKISEKSINKEVTQIEDLISPKLIRSELDKASREGRIIRGKKSRIFGDKPDTVIQTEGVQKASNTIQKRIPNAYKMTDQELSQAMSNDVKTISTELKPEMQNVKIDIPKVKEVNETWNKLKIKQQADADFDDFGGKKLQQNFENRLTQIAEADNLDDLWNIRKEYDNSIPKRIKQAHSGSDGRLQFQKETWLSNRAILNDAINDTSVGLGDVSKQAFSDMTDMYTGIQNIASKTKLTKPSDGWLSKDNLIKLGGIWIGGNIIEKATGIDIPVI